MNKFPRKFWLIFAIAFLSIAGIFLITKENSNNTRSKESETSNGQVIVSGGVKTKNDEARAFTQEELMAAENALENGVRIEDSEDDFHTVPEFTYQPGETRPDNSNPYPIGWTDLRSVSFGADETYIYFKFQFWDLFPYDPTIYEGDLITGTGAQVRQFSFIDGQQRETWAQFQNTISYIDAADTTKTATQPFLHHEIMITPTDQLDEQYDTIFEQFTRAGMIGGGAGTDYIIAAVPLSLFNLKLGDITTFNIGTESGSQKYHHTAIDYLLEGPNPKAIQGDTIQYVIGSDSYTSLGIPESAYTE